MKKSNIRNTLGCILFSTVHIGDAKIAYLDDIANLEILPYGLHFSEVMPFTKITKDVIYNWLLQGNGAMTRVQAYCKILSG